MLPIIPAQTTNRYIRVSAHAAGSTRSSTISGRTSSTAAAVMGRMPRTKAVYSVPMAACTRSGFCAPNACAMTTVPPVAMPENREENKNSTGKPTPTAASAASLT